MTVHPWVATLPAAISPQTVYCTEWLAQFQYVFRMIALTLFLPQPKGLPENRRFHPPVLLARRDVTLRRELENVELNRVLSRIDEPVFRNAGLPIQFAEFVCVL